MLLYADKLTEAIEARSRRHRAAARRLAYNAEHGITPETIVKGVSDIAELLALESPNVPTRRRRGRTEVEGMTREELEKLVVTLEKEMYVAAEGFTSSTRRSCATDQEPAPRAERARSGLRSRPPL